MKANADGMLKRRLLEALLRITLGWSRYMNYTRACPTSTRQSSVSFIHSLVTD